MRRMGQYMIEVPNDEGLDITCQIKKVFNPSDVSDVKNVIVFKVEQHTFNYEFPIGLLTDDNIEEKMEELKNLAIKQYHQVETMVPISSNEIQ